MIRSHCNIHQSSYVIMTSINGYVTLWWSSKFTSYCDNHRWLHVTMRHSWKLTSHCDNYQWLSPIVTLHYHIPQLLCYIAKFMKMHIVVMHVTLQCSSMAMSQYNIHQSLRRIVAYINGYVTLQCSLKFTLHCGIDINERHTTTFINGYVTFWHSWNFNFEYLFNVI